MNKIQTMLQVAHLIQKQFAPGATVTGIQLNITDDSFLYGPHLAEVNVENADGNIVVYEVYRDPISKVMRIK